MWDWKGIWPFQADASQRKPRLHPTSKHSLGLAYMILKKIGASRRKPADFSILKTKISEALVPLGPYSCGTITELLPPASRTPVGDSQAPVTNICCRKGPRTHLSFRGASASSDSVFLSHYLVCFKDEAERLDWTKALKQPLQRLEVAGFAEGPSIDRRYLWPLELQLWEKQQDPVSRQTWKEN